MDVHSLEIPEVKVITPRRFSDDRGFFSETYNARAFKEAGIDVDFVQDNHSYSAQKGTLRGLHYQAPPHAQSKLVRVLRGSIIDVAVDARKASPTFGQWVKAELSAENGRQIFVPRGFLHGFVTLEPDTEVAYKVDAFYDGASDGSVRWNDPALAIDWGFEESEVSLSAKDAGAPGWADFTSPF
ncbi:dTDP-4-dehydrorhamnose 3,5-epimerase [Hyphococcus luteus]|uniref:dTDP-4-dehydrorhamnose 3,5-epimerase n=1 Tax=Hyphococcus luteus TaxID=2058213 RepID=A0A2S7K7V0_9PROT|nr:dTDP-4-dehydrorhamnose 3,5-epimerase [Marinicaulis flavus]PQA88561.1 dTDP-4-dehydrorhamnose 3,5-epimerase [Marinicaulis flavus]